jgi:molybdopterin converting factor small subunit
MKIRVVVTGRGYHMAEQLPEEITLAESAGIGDALTLLASHLTNGHQLPSSCLVSVSGEHLGTLSSHRPRQLRDGDELVLIAPVAGG